MSKLLPKVLLFLILPFLLSAKTDEIKVFLKTKESKKPFYLSKIQVTKSSFSQDFVKKIESIIQDDISHLNNLSLLPFDKSTETLLLQKDPISSLSGKKGIFFLQPNLENNQLSFSFYSKESTNISLPTVVLSENLNKDRKAIHQVLNQLNEKLFGKKSILTTNILFSLRKRAENGLWVSEIWKCDYDGENAQSIIQDEHYHLTPCFIPKRECKQFLFVSFLSGQAKIHTASIETSTHFPLIPLAGNQILPAISQDCDKIAFISDAAGRPDLFLQRIDKNGQLFGKSIQLYSYPRATQASPTFNPDGTKLCFVSDKDGPPRIYLIDIPTTFMKRPLAHLITKRNKENTSPCWSPDGTKLAYSAKTEDIRQIWIYDFETDQEWQVTKGKEHKENPSFASDNCHLVYNTEGELSSELYMINIEDKKPIKISKGPGQKRFASWQTL